jgi:DNA-binding NarL/FixJ family response regulator
MPVSVPVRQQTSPELDREWATSPRTSRELTPRELTPRELRVLTLLADGYRTSEIARELAYSERTIKHAIAAMTSRLELRNRTQAVAFAVRAGLI